MRITHLANKLPEVHPLLAESCFFPWKHFFLGKEDSGLSNMLSRVVASPKPASILRGMWPMPLTTTWSALSQAGSWTR